MLQDYLGKSTLRMLQISYMEQVWPFAEVFHRVGAVGQLNEPLDGAPGGGHGWPEPPLSLDGELAGETRRGDKG